jgi:hypothetical protein
MVVGLTVAAALVAVAGCSSDSTHDSAVATKRPTAAGSSLPKGVKAATSVPTKVPNDPDLRSGVTMNECRAAPAGWVAGGKVTNSGKKSIDYKITVFFTTTGATVIGTKGVTVQVAPGATESWKARGRFRAPAHTLCVLRGVGRAGS